MSGTVGCAQPRTLITPGCVRNINKDGTRFGVRVRSWRSYGKIEDCKQSSTVRKCMDTSEEILYFDTVCSGKSYDNW